MLGGAMNLRPIDRRPSHFRLERSIRCCRFMGVQIVHHQDHFLGVGIAHFQQVAYLPGKIDRHPPRGDGDVSVPGQGFAGREQVGGPTALVFPETTVCPDCGGPLKPLGEDVSERLEYVPSHFRVIRHVRPKRACGRCDRIVQAPAPSRPIARGLAGPGLLAHVLVSKYADHLPLYRQSEIYARAGVDLPRSTLAGWVGEAAALLRPLVEAVRRHVLRADQIHADDTPVPVLAPGKGSTRQGRLWAYVRDGRPCGDPTPPAVWFAYSPDRQGRHPREHLRGFRGALHADGYAGFNGLYETGSIVEVACWAHVRRKFYDLHHAHASPLAADALRRIGALYAVEAELRGQPAEVRAKGRHARAGPQLEAFRAWLQTTRPKPRKSRPWPRRSAKP